jgi:hypothetical protein
MRPHVSLFLSSFLFLQSACSAESTSNDVLNANISRTHSIEFKGSGVSDLVNGGYEQWYTNESNEKVLEAKYCYQSPEVAKTNIDAYIAKAKNVIEQKENPNAPAGAERLRYVFASDDLKEGKFAILKSDGTECFDLISAASVESATDFEANH